MGYDRGMFNEGFEEHVRKSHVIDLGNSPLGLEVLELFLRVLQSEGTCEIRNCTGVMSLMELGAYLAEQAKRP